MPEDFVRGPFELFRVDELRPFPADESFETLTARGVGDLTPLDAVLGAAAAVAVDAAPRDMENAYHELLAPALEDGVEVWGALTPHDLFGFVEAVHVTAGLDDGAQQYLPSPDTPIGVDFVEPPRQE